MGATARPGTSRHLDGSACLAGTSSVPRKGYKPCCAELEVRLTACALDIRYEYWSEPDRWYILLADGTHEGLRIRYCPHCGEKLPRQR